MNKRDILEKIQEIVRDVTDDENIVLASDTTTDQVEGWDSLSHVQIVTEVQDFFNIKFSAREMISWNNVGDLCDNIAIKLK